MTDAEAVARLERLRKKPRSDLKESLVQAVMIQSGSFEDKIRRIEMVDLLPEEDVVTPAAAVHRPKGPLRRPERPAPTPRPSPASAVESPAVLAEPKRVEHARSRLARIPIRGGWWAYLTAEYGALIRFGARTSTLVRGFVPFTIRLSPEVVVFLTKTLKNPVLASLEAPLASVLKKSWLHLTRSEYNLLAALQDLVHRAGSVTVEDGDRLAGGPAWDAVVPAVRLFWTSPDLVEKLLRAWELAVGRLGFPDKTKQAGIESIRTLLEARTDGLSLPDALQALLMLRVRRVVEWSDAGLEPGEYFLKDAFDCTPEVQADIDKAADILAHQLDLLEKEGQEIKRIRYFLPSQNLLGEFEGDERDNKALWCRSFLPRFQASVGPLLGGTVVFADGSRTELFRNPSLDSTLARLALLADQLANPDQTAADELTMAVARVVMNLGKTLVVLIRNRSVSADPLVRSSDPGQLTDPLPHESMVLDLPAAWAGLTVVDALVKTARVCLQAGRFLGETSLETSLEKEANLPQRAAEILTRLGRLVPPARWAELKARWHDPPEVETP